MKTNRAHLWGIGFLLMALVVPFVLAHAQELRIVEGQTTTIEDPTAYRAYYGQLAGEPHVFTFSTDDTLTHVKAVVLVPDREGVRTDTSAAFIDVMHPDDPFVVGEGALIEWQRFFDTAGRESYLAGPTLEATVPAGNYEIRVWSSNNDSSYVLVMEGDDRFSLSQIWSRFVAGPTIKNDFFGKSAASAYFTPLLLWPLLTFFIMLGLVLLLVIVVFKQRTPTSPSHIEVV